MSPPRLLLFLVGCVLCAPFARAQDRRFDLDHLQLALTSPTFLGVEGAASERPFRLHAAATFRHLLRPLIADGDEGSRLLVESRSLVDVSVGIALASWFSAGVELPVLVAQSGEAAPSGFAFGDLRVAARLRAFDLHGVALAAIVACRLPTGARDRFLGEGGPVLEPRLALEWRGGIVRAAINLGARLRGRRDYGDLSVGHELVAAAAVKVQPWRFLDVFAEAHADTALARPLATATSPVEILAGLGVHAGDFYVRAAAGAGLVQGYGDPQARVLVSLGYAPRDRETARPAPGVVPVAKRAPPAPLPPPPPPSPSPPPPAPTPAPEPDEEIDPEEPAVEVHDGEIELTDPVFFETDRAHVRARFRDELLQLSRALAKRPWIRILWIEGHTDDTGPLSWNDALSRLRADRVAQFLVAHGIDRDRLRTLASGQAKPWYPNASPSGRAKNRRVVFLFERTRDAEAAATATSHRPGGNP